MPIGVVVGKVVRAYVPIAQGTITADSTEQTLVEYVGEISQIGGYIDLSSMEEGDEVVIRVYTKIKPDGEWKLYDEGGFYGKQAYPALHILPRVAGYAYKVTLQQASGTYKPFDYLFVKTV
jgi:hypothetical protein